MDDQSKRDLVIRAINGNDAALESLITENYSRVYHVAYAWLNNEAVAEEITQDTFLRVFLTIKQLNKPDCFSAWIFTIARNLAKNQLRDGRQYRSIISLVQEEAIVMAISDPAKNPRQTAIENQNAERLKSALSKLPSELREVLLLHYTDEMSLTAIAKILQVQPSTISRQIDKSIKLLSQEFSFDVKGTLQALRPSSTQSKTVAGLALSLLGLTPGARAGIFQKINSAAPILLDDSTEEIILNKEETIQEESNIISPEKSPLLASPIIKTIVGTLILAAAITGIYISNNNYKHNKLSNINRKNHSTQSVEDSSNRNNSSRKIGSTSQLSGAIVSGRVIDNETSASISGVKVMSLFQDKETFTFTDRNGCYNLILNELSSDDKNQIAIGFLSDKYVLPFSDERHLSTIQDNNENQRVIGYYVKRFDSENNQIELNATMAPAVKRNGTVSDENGKPIPKAKLRVSTYPTGEDIIITDKNGEFYFTYPKNATFKLYASYANHATVYITNKNDISNTNDINIKMKPDITFTGTVTDEANKTINNLSIRYINNINDTNADRNINENTSFTLNGSNFVVTGLEEGDLALSFEAPGYKPFITPFMPLIAGTNIENLEVKLEKDKNSISGVVLTQQNESLTPELVRNAYVGYKSSNSNFPIITRLQPDGSFILSGLDANTTYGLTAGSQATVQSAKHVTDILSGTSGIKLPYTYVSDGSLSFALQNGFTSEPINNFSVEYSTAVKSNSSGSSNTFTLKPVEGEELFIVSAPGYPTIFRNCLDSSILKIYPYQTINGRLVDASTRSPLKNITVQLLNLSDKEPIESTATNDNGEFTLKTAQNNYWNIKFLLHSPYSISEYSNMSRIREHYDLGSIPIGKAASGSLQLLNPDGSPFSLKDSGYKGKIGLNSGPDKIGAHLGYPMRTDINGFFTYSDISSGDYYVHLSLTDKIEMKKIIPLPETTIYRLPNTTANLSFVQNSPIDSPSVRLIAIDDSVEYNIKITSDKEQTLSFPIEPGKYRLTVYKRIKVSGAEQFIQYNGTSTSNQKFENILKETLSFSEEDGFDKTFNLN